MLKSLETFWETAEADQRKTFFMAAMNPNLVPFYCDNFEVEFPEHKAYLLINKQEESKTIVGTQALQN